MSSKLLVCLSLLQLIIVYAQEEVENNPFVRDINSQLDLDNCDETQCTLPCPGAAPPKRCPSNVTFCHYGCACHTDCDIGVVTCFQTKHCLETRRFFTKRRRFTTVPTVIRSSY